MMVGGRVVKVLRKSFFAAKRPIAILRGQGSPIRVVAEGRGSGKIDHTAGKWVSSLLYQKSAQFSRIDDNRDLGD